MKNIFVLSLFLILFYSCSYEPILSKKKNDFEFVNISISGDDKINEVIKNNLLSRTSGNKKYKINLNSEKNIQTVSSDSKGDPKIYKLQIKVDYNVLLDEKNVYENTVTKQATYNNITDKYELLQYENNITKSLSKNIAEELLFSIKTLGR